MPWSECGHTHTHIHKHMPYNALSADKLQWLVIKYAFLPQCKTRLHLTAFRFYSVFSQNNTAVSMKEGAYCVVVWCSVCAQCTMCTIIFITALGIRKIILQ